MKQVLLTMLLFLSATLLAQKPPLTKGDPDNSSKKVLSKTEGTLSNISANLFQYKQIAKGQLEIVKYIGKQKEVNIPSFVELNNQRYMITKIGNDAFCSCTFITSITIPNTIKSIGSQAFFCCSSLVSIKIPNSVTHIGGSPFSRCNSLISIIVERGNSKYDSRNNCNAIIETATNTLIQGCVNTIIPDGVAHIGECAFYASSIKSINIPNSVTSIEYCAFYCCSSLTSVTFPNSLKTIGRSAFVACPFSAIIIPNSVTSIGDQAFESCHSLSSIIIPNNVILGKHVFYDCPKLTINYHPNI